MSSDRHAVPVPPATGRVAVLGDIGGHAEELYAALVGLGADPATLALPPDLSVVSVGDLVHRGPASPDVLRMVDHVLTAQPGRWRQLVGNHEALYLPGAPRFEWPEALPADSTGLLRRWWAEGSMRVAAGIRHTGTGGDGHGPLLVTHAGLTAGAWQELGAPEDLADAVAVLNATPAARPEVLWRTGRMLGAPRPCPDAGPVWAEAGWETYASWAAWAAQGTGAVPRRAPFGQVHGHSTAYWWARRSWNCPEAVAAQLTLAPAVRHVTGQVAGRFVAGIDPCFGRDAHPAWAPLVLHGAELVDG